MCLLCCDPLNGKTLTQLGEGSKITKTELFREQL
jgi:hypothetical protein